MNPETRFDKSSRRVGSCKFLRRRLELVLAALSQFSSSSISEVRPDFSYKRSLETNRAKGLGRHICRSISPCTGRFLAKAKVQGLALHMQAIRRRRCHFLIRTSLFVA